MELLPPHQAMLDASGISPEVIQARQNTGLSQAQFAQALNISKRTLQEWEQGRRAPSGAAKALIRIAKSHPDIVRVALV